MKLSITNEKAITLISLVITIIILLILAGISISQLTSSGLLEKSKLAREKSEIAELSEKLELSKAEVQMESENNILTLEKYLEYLLEHKIIEKSDIEKIDEKNANIILDNKYIFLLEEVDNGDIHIQYGGKVDRPIPIIKNVQISNTTNSITVKVSSKNVEEYEYYIKLSNEETYKENEKIETKDTEYTFTGLSPETKYDIKIIVKNKKEKREKELNEIQTAVFVDNTMPEIISIEKDNVIWDENNGNVKVTARAKDVDSGICAYQFSTESTLTSNSDGWNEIDATIETVQTTMVNKTGKIYFYAKDKFNNVNSAEIDIVITYANYDYSGDVQKYKVPYTGIYQIEAWGASGGDIGPHQGGNGAYTKGEIYLNEGTELYLYVGGQGDNKDEGGYNGGQSLHPGQRAFGSSGGGATDIRIKGGTWNNSESLRNRIMVAAGGGGANYRNVDSAAVNTMYGEGNGGAGGKLVGEDGISERYKQEGSRISFNEHDIGTGGTQTQGGKYIAKDANDNVLREIITGGFGKEIDGTVTVQSGAGSGYYMGGASGHGGAGGGSSFISGYKGCNAIDSNGNHTNQANHFSGYVFSNGIMKAGSENMTNPRTGNTTIGNDANGYIKIKFLF